MAELNSKPVVKVEIILKLTESEARALEAIQGYGADAFLDFFYKCLGRAYLEPHEAGLRSLFTSVKEALPPIFRRVENARKVFEEK